MTTIHSGAAGGMENANRVPVTSTASLTLPPFFFSNRYSTNTPTLRLTASVRMTRGPYSQIDRAAIGASAYRTRRIIGCFWNTVLLLVVIMLWYIT